MVPTIREAFSISWEKMKEILFRPFDWGTWLVLTLAFWLAGLGEGGFNLSFRNLPTDRESMGVLLQPIQTAAAQLNLTTGIFILLIAAILFFFAVTIGLLLLWVRCRARFVVLDMLLRGARAESFGNRWKLFQKQGNSFFFTQILLTVLMVFCGICCGGGIFFALPLFLEKPENGGIDLVTGCLFAALIVILALLSIGFAIYLLLFQEYGALRMYRTGCPGAEALQELNRKLMERPWTFVRYLIGLLIYFVLVTLLIVLFSCLTCCIGGILLAVPFLSTMILLPLLYVRWQYSLEFFDNPEMLD